MLIQIKASTYILKRKWEITQFAAIKVSKRELTNAEHQVKTGEYIARNSTSLDVGLDMAAAGKTQNELICIFILIIGAGTANVVIKNSCQL